MLYRSTRNYDDGIGDDDIDDDDEGEGERDRRRNYNDCNDDYLNEGELEKTILTKKTDREGRRRK